MFFYYIKNMAARQGKTISFQSPEGDSLFFHQEEVAILTDWGDALFQSPEGDSLFFYVAIS